MAPPKILILIPELKEVEPDDNLATISTAKELERHYDRLGYPHEMRHFEYVPAEFRAVVREIQPDCIFNLVESVSGTSRLIHVPPIYIEEINLAYTGSPSHALELSNDKILAKKILNWLDLPTPARGTIKSLSGRPADGTWFVKAKPGDKCTFVGSLIVVPDVGQLYKQALEAKGFKALAAWWNPWKIRMASQASDEILNLAGTAALAALTAYAPRYAAAAGVCRTRGGGRRGLRDAGGRRDDPADGVD